MYSRKGTLFYTFRPNRFVGTVDVVSEKLTPFNIRPIKFSLSTHRVKRRSERIFVGHYSDTFTHRKRNVREFPVLILSRKDVSVHDTGLIGSLVFPLRNVPYYRRGFSNANLYFIFLNRSYLYKVESHTSKQRFTK